MARLHPKARKKLEEKKKAQQEIARLFKKAEEEFPKSKRIANELVRKARRLSMKHRMGLPPTLRRKVCKHCHSYLKPGVNLRVRTRPTQVVYFCGECKRYMRFLYKTKKTPVNH